MKKFIFFARVCTCFYFASAIAGMAQNAGPDPNYVVIGAFKHQRNAVRFTKDATKHNFPARFEMNPTRNLYYVYVLTTTDREYAFAEALKLRTDTKYFDTWVYAGGLGLDAKDALATSANQDFNPSTGEKIESLNSGNERNIAGNVNLQSNATRQGPGEQGAIAGNNILLGGDQQSLAANNRSLESSTTEGPIKNAASATDNSANSTRAGRRSEKAKKKAGVPQGSDLSGTARNDQADANPLDRATGTKQISNVPEGGNQSIESTASGEKQPSGVSEKSASVNPNTKTTLQAGIAAADEGATSDRISSSVIKNENSALSNNQKQETKTRSPGDDGEKQPSTLIEQPALKNANAKTTSANGVIITDAGVTSAPVNSATVSGQKSTNGSSQYQQSKTSTQDGAQGRQNEAVADQPGSKKINAKTSSTNGITITDAGVTSNPVDPASVTGQTVTASNNQNQKGKTGSAEMATVKLANPSADRSGAQNPDGKTQNVGTAKNADGSARIDPVTGLPGNTTAADENNKNVSTPIDPRDVKKNLGPPPNRVSTEPLKPEEVVGKNFYFYLFRTENREIIDGEVDAIDFEKSRKMATYPANAPVKILMPPGKPKQISFVCQVFGYRKLQKEYDPVSPAEDLYLDDKGNLVVPFELMRLQRGDIAIMYNVFFFKDAAVMRPESRYEVNNLLELLNENPSYKIRIHGHTNGNAPGKIMRMDKPGNFYSLTNTKQGAGSAKTLSEERAILIRQYLISSGISADRMEIKAWGGKKPIHDTRSVRANENVRVEIEILSD
jgi:outer membrane protein OmpA-like peptidoglycan-associated protein